MTNFARFSGSIPDTEPISHFTVWVTPNLLDKVDFELLGALVWNLAQFFFLFFVLGMVLSYVPDFTKSLLIKMSISGWPGLLKSLCCL